MEFLQSLNFDISFEFWIIISVIALLLLIQMVYFLFVYLRPYSYEKKRDKNMPIDVELPSVSVIIASQNESENLIKNLPSILEQDYPNFEVIVINMGSTDETNDSLKQIGADYTNLYHTFVPADAENVNSKKLALTLGIKAAKNDILLFTEPYCKPVSNKWIEQFALGFSDNKDIVLGFCKIDTTSKFAMRGLVVYDNLIQHSRFLAMCIMGKPFMGIGRNMAYKKSMFFEEKGFSSVLTYDDGEDDIFINRIASNREAGVVVSPDSMVSTDVVDSSRIWKSLRSKYLVNKRYYKGPSNFIFWLEAASKCLFYLSVIASVVYGSMIGNNALVAFPVIMLVIYFSVALLVINKLSGLFESKRRVHINLLWYELILPVYNYRLPRRAKRRK